MVVRRDPERKDRIGRHHGGAEYGNTDVGFGDVTREVGRTHKEQIETRQGDQGSSKGGTLKQMREDVRSGLGRGGFGRTRMGHSRQRIAKLVSMRA